jgi:outer membrane protein assembly factor BamB
VLLVLAVIFGSFLSVGHQPAKQATQSRPTSETKPSYLPTPSGTEGDLFPNLGHALLMTIADDVAYVGTADERIYALRISNGSLLWRFEVEGEVSRQPLVANGVVYISSLAGQNGPSHIYALRTGDGRLLWQYSSNSFSYISLSTTDSNVAYVSSGEGISAFKNGSLLWRVAISGFDSGVPQIVNGVVYASSFLENGSGEVYALRATDGTVLWHNTADGFPVIPIVADGVAYITSDGGVLTALRASDGHQLWKQTIDADVIQSVQMVNGVIYTAAIKMSPGASIAPTTGPLLETMANALLWNTRQMAPARATIPLKLGVSSVYAIRASDGKPVWHYSLANGKNSWVNWFAVEQGAVYASTTPMDGDDTSQGDVYALQSGNGSVLWHDKLKVSPFRALLANGVIYLSSSKGEDAGAVYAIQAKNGSLLWSYATSGPIQESPILADKALYVGTINGIIYALQAKNGALLWHYPKANGS